MRTEHTPSWHADTRGTTAIEYALIAGGVALAIIVGVTLLGGSTSSFFNDVATTTTNTANP